MYIIGWIVNVEFKSHPQEKNDQNGNSVNTLKQKSIQENN